MPEVNRRELLFPKEQVGNDPATQFRIVGGRSHVPFSRKRYSHALSSILVNSRCRWTDRILYSSRDRKPPKTSSDIPDSIGESVSRVDILGMGRKTWQKIRMCVRTVL